MVQCQFLGDEFGNDFDISVSEIRVDRLVTGKSGDRTFRLDFFHANYPEGVQDKSYRLRTIHRGEHSMLVESIEHQPKRYLYLTKSVSGQEL